MKTKSTIHKLISALCLLTTLAAQTASGFYDPNLQRWLTLDPIGEAGGANLYQFVGNNPINGIDPDGREVLNYYIAPNGQPTSRAPDVGYHPARYKAAGLIGVSLVPGVGEAMDVDVLTDPESAWWEKALAGTSLGLNAITEGLLPNAGAFLKGGKSLCKVPAQARKAEMSYDAIMRQISALDFGTPRNGAVFWTGYRQGNQTVAMNWAKANGKYTIEMTPGGKWLNGLDLFGPNSPLSRAKATELWNAASLRFSEAASGHVTAFTRGTTLNPNTAFYGVELPALRANPNVLRMITYRGY